MYEIHCDTYHNRFFIHSVCIRLFSIHTRDRRNAGGVCIGGKMVHTRSAEKGLLVGTPIIFIHTKDY